MRNVHNFWCFDLNPFFKILDQSHLVISNKVNSHPVIFFNIAFMDVIPKPIKPDLIFLDLIPNPNRYLPYPS